MGEGERFRGFKFATRISGLALEFFIQFWRSAGALPRVPARVSANFL
ncbi:MAG: hypothetical protein JWR21_3220 [Herminiimonas sp.]|nr:hypothetical protein [Herminiimonas sp.]MDB5854707.1 hypothetical protein [Herminiimonas sp.]